MVSQFMLCTAAETLPLGPEWSYEPKADGFRGLLVREGERVDLWSRRNKSLSVYFPELKQAAVAALPSRCASDGEIVAIRSGGISFEALRRRLSRRLGCSTFLAFLAFDVVSLGSDDCRFRPLWRRRELLWKLVRQCEPIIPVAVTDDGGPAEEWLSDETPGIEGVVAKRVGEGYVGGRRSWVKVKRGRTVDVVVGGCRPGNRLLLGLYHADGAFSHVGDTVRLSAGEAALVGHYLKAASAAVWTGRRPGRGHWEGDRYGDWADCEPELVTEVSYTLLECWRFRQPARLVRLRPDREASGCGVEQLMW